MRERHCCDGLCARGRHCPAFAPGVIEHHRTGAWERVKRTAKALWLWLGEPAPW